MSDHCEEQEMEAEALAAIFDTAFEVVSSTQPFEWSVKLLPVDCGGDEHEEEQQNHVAIKLCVSVPLDYPESLPDLDIEIMKGLTEEHKKELLELANTEASNNQGMPAVFAICESLREWLINNNTKGLDDASMHAQMMRRAQEAERKEAMAQQQFEAQRQQEELTEAEREDLEVRRRRAEGTPCTKENFLTWKAQFDAEMAEEKKRGEQEEEKNASSRGKKGDKNRAVVDKSDRQTGFAQFSNKTMNMDLIEAAAAEAEEEEMDPEELLAEGVVDEALFNVDDEDLDDLDFDDEEDFEDDDDDEEEQPDI